MRTKHGRGAPATVTRRYTVTVCPECMFELYFGMRNVGHYEQYLCDCRVWTRYLDGGPVDWDWREIDKPTVKRKS